MKELFLKYYVELIFYANKLLEDENTARDVAIECIIKIAKKDYDANQKTIRHLLYLSVRNKCIDIKKHKNRYNLVEIKEQTTENAILEYDVILEFHDLYLAIKQLSPACQQVVYLHFFKNKSCVEIGEMLNKTASTIRSLKLKALVCLRKNLPYEHISNLL